MSGGRVHLVGVGGVGMAGLAVLLKARGYDVSGCDLHATARTRWLEANGIRVLIGHDRAHLDGVDEIVVTPAVPDTSDELVAARAKGIGVRFRGEVLAELVNAAPDSIAVCGSHGKTTTATWIARLLLALGEDVAWAIGGETGDFPVAGGGGQRKGSVLVVEADESDGTLERYHAKTLVVTNCEYDHPDHFKTPADYFACYETAKKNARTVIESENLDAADPPESISCTETLAPHNRKNARAAIEVALRRGHKPGDIAAALPAIVRTLPDRRFQKIADAVYTDYAHHPTEMRCAVGMARQKCRGTLRVLFQPHRYSRTKALLKDFPAAFAGADEVVLIPVYAAFEQPLEGGGIADLYRECRASAVAGTRFLLARSREEAWEHARNSMTPGDLTLLLGAGDIIRLVPRVLRDFSSDPDATAPKRPDVRKIWIGMGSNTWKSDLNLSVRYVKTEGPAGAPGATLGIPWMAGIPGTIGGWIKMNAGAFGHSISEVLEAVKVDGEWRPASDCGFAYRHSDIQGEIQDFKLKPAKYSSRGQSPTDEGGQSPADEAAGYLARRKKFPAGTWGSVFKNPEGDFAGRLLEAAGAKELKVGGAYVWSEHANVIVAGPGSVPSDVLALAGLMRDRVRFRFGVVLEPEVCGLSLPQ